MSRFVRFVFLPVFFSVFLLGNAWAVVPKITGTYKAISAKYISESLSSAQSITVTVQINQQFGRLFKGSATVGATSHPISGRLEIDNKTITISGFSVSTVQGLSISGEYIAPNISAIYFNIFGFSELPDDALFDFFRLIKQ